jgi:hypothetical protein
MELFPAADDDAWTLIERVIDASDYYLLVIGGKYGSIDPATELSYTEREFDYAVAAGKPVMAFLHENPDDIAAGKSEKSEEAQAKLAAFRKKVEQLKHVKYWGNADSLQGKVAMSFAAFTKSYPAIGWIRGDVETAAGALAEINELRKQLEASEAQLTTARTSPPPGIEDLEQGSDVFVTAVSAETESRTDKKTYLDTWEWTTWTGKQGIDPTWDELFSAIGPTLLDEAEQNALNRTLNRWITERWGAAFRQSIRDQSGKDGIELKAFRSTSLVLSTDDFGTVVVQLRALGLIQKSDRKRAVSDKGTYWTLTPYGDTHLTTLRALRKTPATAETAESEGEDGDEE